MNKGKGIINILIIATVVGSTFTISGCTNNSASTNKIVNRDNTSYINRSYKNTSEVEDEKASENITEAVGSNSAEKNIENSTEDNGTIKNMASSDGNEYIGKLMYILDGDITITPKHVYYDNGDLVMKAYIHNGLDYEISDIRNVQMKLEDSRDVISEAFFGNLSGAVILPKSYIEWTFTFGKDVILKDNADLSTLAWDITCNYSNSEYYLVTK